MSMREHLILAMLKRPDLTIDGIHGDERPDFLERRTELIVGVDQFERAVRWLSQIPRTTHPNRSFGSYFAKHAAERWAGAYVSNGALIAAALYIGHPIEDCPSRINCHIAVAGQRKWPKGIDQCVKTANTR